MAKTSVLYIWINTLHRKGLENSSFKLANGHTQKEKGIKSGTLIPCPPIPCHAYDAAQPAFLYLYQLVDGWLTPISTFILYGIFVWSEVRVKKHLTGLILSFHVLFIFLNLHVVICISTTSKHVDHFTWHLSTNLSQEFLCISNISNCNRLLKELIYMIKPQFTYLTQ